MNLQFALRPTYLAITGFLVTCPTIVFGACSATDNTNCASSLANSPLQATSTALPNILFVLDDSISMSSAVPDSGGQTRLQVAKTAAKSLIDSLDGVRTGLFSYRNAAGAGSDGGELNELIGDLTSTKKTTMKDKIDALTASNFTPLAETLSGVGRYFATGYTGNLTLHPGTPSQDTTSTAASAIFKSYGNTTTTAPIQYWCQRSFSILLTDGLPTQDADVHDKLKEYYGYCTANSGNCTGTLGRRRFQLSNITSGTPTTTPESYETTFADSSDYLDDVANALFDIDLRPDLVPATGTKPSKNNVTTYTIAFADPALASTTLIERAASYGGGLYFTADNATSLAQVFNRIKDDLIAKDGAAAAVAVANAHITNTDNASYATSYNSGNWTGDLIAYPINTNTGIPDVTNPIWNTGCAASYLTTPVDANDATKGNLGCSARIQLDSKAPSDRLIVTSDDSTTCRNNCGTPFQTANLSTAQLARLNTPGFASADNDNVIAYLRGTRTGETAGVYRTRTNILGDTINAEPAIVTKPSANYSDLGYKAAWVCNIPNPGDVCTPFVTAKENRARIVIQPSNDGMVHAFNALTGSEEWAYIPGFLINSENDPANASTALLNTRTRNTGFNHYHLVDATPVVGDVDFDKAGNPAGSSAGPDWRTLVVGGLGKGGRGYYALDVTSTTAADEAGAAAKVLWEFPRSIQDATKRAEVTLDMGYSYGKPVITKTEANGWVVLVTAGYNNGADAGQSGLTGATSTSDSSGDGYGHLYVINAKTGDLIKDIETPMCNTAVTASAANSQLYPCGLTHINGYVEERDTDNTTTLVYGGDLYGNVWRFDLRGTSSTSWSVTKLAVLRSGSTASSPLQPITSAPELGAVTTPPSVSYYVYIGTGQYLDKNDLPCPASGTCAWTANSRVTQTQSMYGLIDPRPSSPGSLILPDPLRGDLQAQTFTVSGTSKTLTTNTLASTKKGWVVDFTGGERIFTDPALAAGTLVFTTNTPSTETCSAGGTSWLYAVDYLTGGQVSGATWAGTFIANALGSRPVLVQLPNGKLHAIVRTSDGKSVSKDLPTAPTADVGRRISWRELIDQ